MPLFSLLISAVAIVAGTLFLIVGCSYLAYRLKRKSPYTQRYF